MDFNDAEFLSLRQAALRLGVSRLTLTKKIRQMGITTYQDPLRPKTIMLRWGDLKILTTLVERKEVSNAS